MRAAGTIDTTADHALPAVSGPPVSLTTAQADRAKQYLVSHWPAAVG